MDQLAQKTLEEQIQAAVNFFNPRGWSKENNRIWSDTLDGFTAHEIRAAFAEYYKSNEYMPKPASIRKLVLKHRKDNPRALGPASPAPTNPKPQGRVYTKSELIIQAAWYRLNKLAGLPVRLDCDAKHFEISDDQAVLICNYEAKRLNSPGGIPDRFWLSDVWGRNQPKLTPLERYEELQRPRIESLESSGPVPDYTGILEGVAG